MAKSKKKSVFLKGLDAFICRELFLDGNELGCEGAADLIRYCAAQGYKEFQKRLEDQAIQEEEEKRRAEEAEKGEECYTRRQKVGHPLMAVADSRRR